MLLCHVLIWIMVWVNQLSQYNFAKVLGEVADAKEACRWGFWCDYAVFCNGCFVEISIFHCASNTHRTDFLNAMAASLVRDLLFIFPELVILCLLSWPEFRSQSLRRLYLSKLASKWWDYPEFPFKGPIFSKDMVMWTCSLCCVQTRTLRVSSHFSL